MHRSSKAGKQDPPALHPPYLDYAAVTDDWVLWQLKNGGNSPAESKRLHAIAKLERNLFPVKLQMMLDQTSRSSQESVVSWLPHGRAFKVHDKKRFVQEVMPQHFGKQTKFKSFLRQLSNYGFMQLTGSSSATAHGWYYHMCCLRDRSVLCRLIACPIVTTSRVRRVFDTTSEPNFDRLPMLNDSIALGEYAVLPSVEDPLDAMASHFTHSAATVSFTEGMLLNTPAVPDRVGPLPAMWLPHHLSTATHCTQPTGSFARELQTFHTMPISNLPNSKEATCTLQTTHPWNRTDVDAAQDTAMHVKASRPLLGVPSNTVGCDATARQGLARLVGIHKVMSKGQESHHPGAPLATNESDESNRSSFRLQDERNNVGDGQSGSLLNLYYDCGSSMGSNEVAHAYELE